jgi:iron complex transport system substrate-binding protein
MEEIVRLQPEVLVFASAHAGNTQRDIDELRTRPGWKNLAAMRNGNIVVVSDAINRPAPRMVDAVEQLARALHPEAFAGGTGFSLRGLVLASPKPRRLKPVPLASEIEEACACAL